MSNDRYALAVAWSNTEGQVLFGCRRANLKEYPCHWSLPSASVSREDYRRSVAGPLPADVVHRLSFECFDRTVESSPVVVRTAVRDRGSYRLTLALAVSELSFEVGPASTKYSQFGLMTPEQLLVATRRRVSTCVSLLLLHLRAATGAELGEDYLELSPLLADSDTPLEERGAAELWQLAAPNYRILVEGQGGSDGGLLRSLTLDRFMEAYVNGLPSTTGRVLELGCGSGDLLRRVRRRGFDAEGLELVAPPSPDASELDLTIESIANLEAVYQRGSFDVVIANLLFEWIDDLESSAMYVAGVLATGGRLIVSTVVPDTAKNLRWAMVGDRQRWILDKPVRRAPFLTMINRSVGPVWYFPRTLPEYVNAFTRAGLCCEQMRYVYLDTMLDSDELVRALETTPAFRRHVDYPVFLVLEFVKPRVSELTTRA